MLLANVVSVDALVVATHIRKRDQRRDVVRRLMVLQV